VPTDLFHDDFVGGLTIKSWGYLMMGRIPVIGELHKRILKTFGNIIRKDNSIEKDIALRQLALKGQN
jgi:hypothetical protein